MYLTIKAEISIVTIDSSRNIISSDSEVNIVPWIAFLTVVSRTVVKVCHSCFAVFITCCFYSANSGPCFVVLSYNEHPEGLDSISKGAEESLVCIAELLCPASPAIIWPIADFGLCVLLIITHVTSFAFLMPSHQGDWTFTYFMKCLSTFY